MGMGCSLPRFGLTTFLGACTALTSFFDIYSSRSAIDTAAFFGECCTNSTVVRNCKDIVCSVLTEELQKDWLTRVITGSLYAGFAAGVLIVVSRCTCVESSELKDLSRAADAEAG